MSMTNNRTDDATIAARRERGALKTLAAASVGNLGELYDFAIFTFSIPVLSRYFFPAADPTASLLATLAVYGVAYVARPFGGLLFGILADRIGRIRVLSASIWLMALGTLSIGILPTYATIGIAAPILLVLCRCAQGLAMGGETTGNAAFALESAPPGSRGRWIGLTWFFGFGANAIAALFITTLQLAGGAETYADWLWRLPFWTGGLIGIVGWWLRRSLHDPEEFVAARQERQCAPQAGTGAGTEAAPSLIQVGHAGKRSLLRVVFLNSTLSVGANTMLAFFYPYLIRKSGLDQTTALLTNAAAIGVLAAMFAVSGALSDRLGRRPVLALGAIWVALAAFPAISIAGAGGVPLALVGQLLLAIGVGLYGGAAFTTMPEMFPTSFRATGHAIAYNSGTVLFGGTAPFVTTWLEHRYGVAGPAGYLILMGLVGATTAALIPESSRSDLRHSVG